MLSGGLLSLLAGLWLVVAAFRTSFLWGAIVLLVPFAALVFVFMEWSRAAKPFLLSLVAMSVLLTGFVMVAKKMRPDSPGVRALAEKLGITAEKTAEDGTGLSGAAENAAIPEPTPAQVLSQEELEQMQKALNATSAELRARKAALKPGDANAAAKLTADIEGYNQELAEFLRLRAISNNAATTHGYLPAHPKSQPD